MLITASAIIEQSWLLYIKCWPRLATYMALLFASTVVLFGMGILSVYASNYFPITTLASNIVIVFIFIASVIFSFWVTLALTLHIKAIFKNESQLSWQGYLTVSAPLLLPCIGATSLLVLLIIFGGLLLFIPGLIFAIWYAFAKYFILFENKSILASFSASKQLVMGRWFAITWRLVLPSLLFLLAFRIAELVILVPAQYLVSELTLRLITRVVDSLALALVVPLTAAPIILLFFSAKETPITQNAAPVIPTP